MKAKKVKLFVSFLDKFVTKGQSKLEEDVNGFLQDDGKSMRVLDVIYQANETYYSVLVYYEEL